MFVKSALSKTVLLRLQKLTLALVRLAPDKIASVIFESLKSAPIQVSGIGYRSPGLTTIDYRLTFRLQTFPQEEILFLGQPIYLDYPFGFYLHQIELSPNRLPANSNGYLTFGCLNRWTKVSSVVLLYGQNCC